MHALFSLAWLILLLLQMPLPKTSKGICQSMSLNTIGIKTLGCKLNFSESATIERLLTEKGYRIVPFEEEAEVYIINSCAVTAEAEKKCRYYARQVKKKHPASKTAIIGCFSSLRLEELIREHDADIILGSNNKTEVVNKIESLLKSPSQDLPLYQAEDKTTFFSAYSLHERTRSFLKIQDGCDYFCAYCTVPYARGHSRSNSIASVIKDAKTIVANGIKEIILSGVNIGDFKTAEGENFYNVLEALIKVEGLQRLRISSIEPNLLTKEIIELAASTKQILPHFHIPLQSGCDDVLHRMKRRYKREVFAEKVHYIKQLMPDACIAVDVIAGFPGESEADFRDSYDFIHRLPISYLHAFPYSRRPGTLAYDIPNQLSKACKNERNQQLLALSHEKKHTFYTENLHRIREVLFESETSSRQLVGFTDNYIKVSASLPNDNINAIRNIQLSELLDDDTVLGIDIYE